MIRKVMDAIYQSVGGLDVHQETVVACRRRLLGDGQAESENEEKTKGWLVKRLEKLGYEVELKPKQARV
jgi:hypothetical protein